MKNRHKLTTLALIATLIVSTSGITAHAASTYTVKSGDVLWKIASYHNVTIANIKEWNGLKSDLIYPGQPLYIQKPQEETSSSTYKVRNGDTLYKISLKYKTTVKEIKRLNGLTSDMIYVGQQLKVSGNTIVTPVVPAFLANGKFPLKKGTYSPFGDTWNDSRTYGGERSHEGTDIMAPKGTKIYAAIDGKIVNFGWSELGGWRISIKTSEGYNLYYAHMSKYASGMEMGAQIKKGQLIGYVGNTGYGPEGTSGKFDSHLHFGMYDSNWKAMNSYNHLKYWEAHN